MKLAFTPALQEVGLLGQVAASFLQVPAHPVVLAEKQLQLVPNDVFEARDRDLAAAFPAKVFRALGGNVHLVAARAMRQAAKQMHRHLAGLLPRLQLLLNDLVDVVPKAFGDDERTFGAAPLGLRLRFGAPCPGLAHGVEHVHSFGVGFIENA